MLHWQISVAFYGASLCHRLKPGVPCSIDSETALRRNLQQKACCLDLWDLRVMMIVDTLLMCSHLKGACAGISWERRDVKIMIDSLDISTIFNDIQRFRLEPLEPTAPVHLLPPAISGMRPGRHKKYKNTTPKSFTNGKFQNLIAYIAWVSNMKGVF